MSLAPGTRLGPYEILSAVGAGGMGEVYRARDTKLDRDVAIKVLPEAVATDPERVARFQREAKTLALLNHPHIGAIYGFEDTAAVKALILEFVDGPTLADRLAAGPLPVDEALAIARQIADALEAAHESGVVHRDLKPANIKLRPDGTVKVLDFGLAKALTTEAAGPSNVTLTNSPTLTSPIALSGIGVLLGTAAYMSPEQARGKPVDKRADIWSFGCVLYEMLTGRRPFEGEDVSLTLAAIMKSEPDLSVLPRGLPSAARIYLLRCLQKDPKQRVRDIGDVRLALDGAYEIATASPVAPVVATPTKSWRIAIALGAVALFAAAVSAVITRLTTTSPGASERTRSAFTLNLPASTQFRFNVNEPIAISADGHHIVFTGRRGTTDYVFVRAVDQVEAVPVRGLEGVVGSIFLSPDGEWIGFNDPQEASIRKIRVSGGTPATICKTGLSAGFGFQGATWSKGGTIVFSTTASSALMQVAEAGGTPEPVAAPAEGESHLQPHFLPNGRGLLFTARKRGAPDRVGFLGGQGEPIRYLLEGSSPHFSVSGHVLFVREETLWAVAFDPGLGAISGNPAPVLENVQIGATGRAQLSLASNGTLVYVPVSAAGGMRTLVWVDRDAQEKAIPIQPQPYSWARISPDGTRLALEVQDRINPDIWTYDLERRTLMKLTSSPEANRFPLWTPDGKRIVFASGSDLVWMAADGTGPVETLLPGTAFRPRPAGWTSDQKLVYDFDDPEGDTFLLPVSGDRKPQPVVVSAFNNQRPALSPDRRWIAYQSSEAGRSAIYVRPFPLTESARWRISTGEGFSPIWSSDSRELFYNDSGQNAMLRVGIEGTSRFRASSPQVLFQREYFWGAAPYGRPYDLASDGRFLMIKPDSGTSEGLSPAVIVELNWDQELKRLVPTE